MELPLKEPPLPAIFLSFFLKCTHFANSHIDLLCVRVCCVQMFST